VANYYATGIPPRLPHLQFDWFYLNTGMMLFLMIVMFFMTLVAVLLGQRIAGNRLDIKHLVSYFFLFGLLAPLWLARAAWDAVLSRERGWLT
jgi:hypothetical protein